MDWFKQRCRRLLFAFQVRSQNGVLRLALPALLVVCFCYVLLSYHHQTGRLQAALADAKGHLQQATSTALSTKATHTETLSRLQELERELKASKESRTLEQLSFAREQLTHKSELENAVKLKKNAEERLKSLTTLGETFPDIKIYVYDMPPKFTSDVTDKNPSCLYDSNINWQSMYSAESFIHDALITSSVRTTNASEANLFFVPLYSSCYLHGQNTDFRKLQLWIREGHEYITVHHPFWNRTNGLDHIFVFSHDLGACVADLTPFRNSIVLSTFADLGPHQSYMEAYTKLYGGTNRDLSLPCFNPWKDIVIPPMISNPKLYAQARGGNPVNAKGELIPVLNRTVLASFRGAVLSQPQYSRSIRQTWAKQFLDDPVIKITNIHPKQGVVPGYVHEYIREMQESVFCLSPPGWAPWSLRPWESIMLGCIPVFITDNVVLPFETLRLFSYNDISFRISEEAAKKNLKETLLRIPKFEIERRQANLKVFWRLFTYQRKRFARRITDPINFKEMDSFDLILLELSRKVRLLQPTIDSLKRSQGA
eukprot:GILK01010722.1.p1 GENE.GILK01010722.1~~GILK01010722.1.p1  ORF type:complete len:540 (-),score=46.88 GILK01010722.1:230-1849(-)